MTESEQTAIETNDTDPTWEEAEPIPQETYAIGDVIKSRGHNFGKPSAVFSVERNAQGELAADLVAVKVVGNLVSFGMPGGNALIKDIDGLVGKIPYPVIETWLGAISQ